MSQTEIEKQCFNAEGAPEAAGFLPFLVKEGYRLSRITQEQLESIQFQIAELLADRFNRWTGGMSSSIPVETGQGIQQSTLYTIGYYLKSIPDPESALELLRTRRLKDLFEEGLRLLKSDCGNAKLLLREIRENGFRTDIIAYNDTIQEGLGLFFTAYDMDFGAHESPGSIDYPLGNDKMNLTGLEYVLTYLTKLRMEDKFCRQFPADEIHSLFRGYDPQYRELLFNMYDLIFVNAVGSLLLERNESELSISPFDRQFLQRKLEPLEKKAREQLVDDAVAALQNALSISDPFLTSYLRQSSANLKSRLNAALENQSLGHLFLSSADDLELPYILYHDDPPIENDRFRRLAEEIRECRLVSDKIRLLQAEPHSIRDLVDLLEGDCFFDGEFTDLFSSMDDLRLALLIQNLPTEPGNLDLLHEEFNQTWQIHFDRFLMRMDPIRRADFLKKAGLIRLELPSEQRFC